MGGAAPVLLATKVAAIERELERAADVESIPNGRRARGQPNWRTTSSRET